MMTMTMIGFGMYTDYRQGRLEVPRHSDALGVLQMRLLQQAAGQRTLRTEGRQAVLHRLLRPAVR